MAKPEWSLKFSMALDQMVHDSETLISKVFEGFLKHRRKDLDEAQQVVEKIEQEARRLIQVAVSAQAAEEAIGTAAVMEISAEIQKLAYSAEKMAGTIRNKIEEGIIFSDKAVLELKNFFEAVQTGLHNVHDLLQTGNPVLAAHVLENAQKFEETGRRYAEDHQNRLIKGVCLPKSSLIYLLILEDLKDILRYTKNIAVIVNPPNEQ